MTTSDSNAKSSASSDAVSAGSRTEFDRQQALAARPLLIPTTNPRKRPDGSCQITVTYQPTRMQRLLLRLGPTATRNFELDPLGTSVLDLCDGQRNVTQIIDAFTAQHRFDPHESERAVLTFLRTLIQNGVVVMVIPETRPDASPDAPRDAPTP